MLFRSLEGAAAGGGALLHIERLRRVGDDGEERARDPLAAHVEDRPHLGDALHPAELVGDPPEVGERPGREEVAGRRRRADDAIAVGGAEAVGELVDERELGVVVAQERPQVVIEPQAGDAEDGERRQDGDEGEGRGSPAAGSRCRSSGSTIHSRQLIAPQRHSIAASAGQQ